MIGKPATQCEGRGEKFSVHPHHPVDFARKPDHCAILLSATGIYSIRDLKKYTVSMYYS